MATLDFTKQLQELEQKEALRMASFEVIYDRVTNDEFIPGVTVELYVNPKNKDDRFYSARSACETVGLSRNWLNASFSRPRVMERLESLGFGQKRMIQVKSSGQLSKPCVALDGAAFDALLKYAKEVGKPQAKAISGAFMGLGLISIAGMGPDSPEETRQKFIYFYNEMLAGQAVEAAKNVR